MSVRDNQIPFFLHEAVLTLYPAAADGTALEGAAVWWGALANRLRHRMDYDEVLIAGSGESYATAHHVDEQHIIEIDRSWLLRKHLLSDFVPGRNQQYVLEAVFNSGPLADRWWYRRTWFGLTARSVNWDSNGANQFLMGQVWRAQRFTQTGGPGQPDVFTPLPPGSTDEQSIGFFRENPLINGEYLLGHYRWPVGVLLKSARAIAWASQDDPTELTLEVNGVLTSHVVTLPAGAPGEEVTVDLDLGNHAVGLGQSVRWKITSAPIPELSAWIAALTMQVQPV